MSNQLNLSLFVTQNGIDRPKLGVESINTPALTYLTYRNQISVAVEDYSHTYR